MIAQIVLAQRSLAFSLVIMSAALPLLYGWTWTASLPLQVQVDDGRCTAVLDERSGEIIYARALGPARNRCLQEAFPGRAPYPWQPEQEFVALVTWGDQVSITGSERQPASPT